MQAYPKDGGVAISKGDGVVDFRGGTAFFVAVTREPQGNSEGRVATIRPGQDWPETEPATLEALLEDHRTLPWNERLSWYKESFPSVYGLVIR